MSSFFVTNFGIDLGTANTLIYIPGKGIVYREATAIAIEEETGRVIAIGNKAKEMIDKTPSNIKAIRPLKDGVIADFTATKLMLRELLNLIFNRFKTLKPSVVVGIPLLITENGDPRGDRPWFKTTVLYVPDDQFEAYNYLYRTYGTNGNNPQPPAGITTISNYNSKFRQLANWWVYPGKVTYQKQYNNN